MVHPVIWYLSFVDDSGFLGGCHAEGATFQEALESAHVHGCNPGGEVKGLDIGEMEPDYELWRLYSKEEINRIGGGGCSWE